MAKLVGTMALLLVCVFGFIGVIHLLAYPFERNTCDAHWQSIPHEYHIVGGCLVQDSRGRMIPESAYREVAP